ncbi:MAG: iron-containing alcohol dehydrogenase [Candidatus Marinimicrobia bacterium]|nr:iron-containing alcohol dehydrogenase [Candidatus Neomarinimicrobiota bacterium]MDD5583166.1 iron-containing alcohol dehydrogenase [Candidatus Neomarinimicrobiota bacterium]
MRTFTLHIPTRFVFGWSTLDRIGRETKRVAQKVLLVCSSGSVMRTGIFDRVIKSLNQEDIEVDVFDKVIPNPRASTMNHAGELARDLGVQAIIGLGGGSAMDTAKGAAIVAVNGGSIWDYIHTHRTVNNSLPVIAVPTLSATGSEGNAYGVVTDDKTLQKASFICFAARPKIALIDPQLSLTVPENYLKDGAIDVICHALEAFFTTRDEAPFNNHFSLLLARTAADMILEILKYPYSQLPRETFAWTATLALSDLNDAGREGPYAMHALAHPLSGLYNISHGRALAFILPRYLLYFKKECYHQILELGATFGDTKATIESAFNAFLSFLKKIDRFLSWQDILSEKPDIKTLTHHVFTLNQNRKGFVQGPRPMTQEDIKNIYTLSLYL